MTYYAHTLVWPLLTAVLAGVLFFWLRPRLGKLLLDRKHPIRFMLAWLALVGVWLGCTALIYGAAERTGLNAPAAGHDHHH
ncbi:MAG TPA: hypothetical protein VE085_05950 [Burkholderiales bacterium]|nr:hypothetical protein [Burkholderiales bacterium]